MGRETKRFNMFMFFFILLFTVASVCTLHDAISFFVDNASYKKSALQTTGTITQISTYYKQNSDGDDVKHYKVYVDFFVRDSLYSGELNYHKSGMKEGQTVKIYYDSDNPSNFRGDGSLFSPIVKLLGGIILLFIGTYSFVAWNNEKREVKQFKKSANRVLADITDVKKGEQADRTVYRIISQWTDNTDGTIYTYISESFTKDPRGILDKKNIAQLPVYIDNQNYENYIVDTDVLFNDKNHLK